MIPWSLQKKYLEVCECLEDLEKGLELAPHTGRVYRSPKAYENKGVGKAPDPRSGAIVPFLKTAPIERPFIFNTDSPDRPVPLDVPDRVLMLLTTCSNSRVGSHYYRVVCGCIQIAVYLPLLMLICLCAYVILMAFYLAFHPQVLVRLLMVLTRHLVSLGLEHVASEVNLGGSNDSWFLTWF